MNISDKFTNLALILHQLEIMKLEISSRLLRALANSHHTNKGLKACIECANDQGGTMISISGSS